MSNNDQDLKQAIQSFGDIPDFFFKKVQPMVAMQVQAIDKRTEKATNDILSAVEKISEAVANLPADQQTAFQDQINAIFEASTFQDLVSQHANEIKILVDDVAADMTDLRDFIGSDGTTPPRERSRDKNKREGHELMNGPSVTDDVTAEDILKEVK